MVTEKDKKMAERCLRCPVCRYARKKQKGLLFWLVEKIANKLCPFCKAYEKVYGPRT